MTGSPPLSDTSVTGSLTADEEGECLQRSRSPVFVFLRSVLLEGPHSSLQLSYTARKVFRQGAELFREEAKHRLGRLTREQRARAVRPGTP